MRFVVQFVFSSATGWWKYYSFLDLFGSRMAQNVMDDFLWNFLNMSYRPERS